jgi:hypothetical protein
LRIGVEQVRVAMQGLGRSLGRTDGTIGRVGIASASVWSER